MSASYTKDDQFLRDMANAKKQKVKDERIIEKMEKAKEQLATLKNNKAYEINSIKKSKEYFMSQVRLIDDKEKICQKKYKDRKKKVLKKIASLNTKIQTPSLKQNLDDYDTSSDEDDDSFEISDIDSDSTSSSDSSVTNQVIMPTPDTFKEREKLYYKRLDELQKEGKKWPMCIVSEEFPDVYARHQEEERKERELEKQTPEYRAREELRKQEQQELKLRRQERQEEIRQAELKFNSALQSFKDAKLKNKPQHEIEGLRIAKDVAEQEFIYVKNKYPFGV